VLAFVFIVQNNYQRATFLNASNGFTGSILHTYSNISEYFSLKKTNVLLAEENMMLRQQLESSYLVTDTNVFHRKDSLFRFLKANIIRNTVNRQKNYITLDKGSRHGIKKDMGVIGSKGVVGTVVEVSKNYSKVMSLLHIQNKINARIKKNRHLGNLEWSGGDYRIGNLTDIPNHVALYRGDTIITSGNSHIFPEGILLGTVHEYSNNSEEKFNTAQINLSVDFNNLHHVYVIVNLMKQELEKVEGKEEE